MGLKGYRGLNGYRLWVMGQLNSTYRAPPRGVNVRRVSHVAAVFPAAFKLVEPSHQPVGVNRRARVVALQVVYLKGEF
jgi:hypothetical protein